MRGVLFIGDGVYQEDLIKKMIEDYQYKTEDFQNFGKRYQLLTHSSRVTLISDYSYKYGNRMVNSLYRAVGMVVVVIAVDRNTVESHRTHLRNYMGEVERYSRSGVRVFIVACVENHKVFDHLDLRFMDEYKTNDEYIDFRGVVKATINFEGHDPTNFKNIFHQENDDMHFKSEQYTELHKINDPPKKVTEKTELIGLFQVTRLNLRFDEMNKLFYSVFKNKVLVRRIMEFVTLVHQELGLIPKKYKDMTLPWILRLKLENTILLTEKLQYDGAQFEVKNDPYLYACIRNVKNLDILKQLLKKAGVLSEEGKLVGDTLDAMAFDSGEYSSLERIKQLCDLGLEFNQNSLKRVVSCNRVSVLEYLLKRKEKSMSFGDFQDLLHNLYVSASKFLDTHKLLRDKLKPSLFSKIFKFKK